MKQFLSIAAFLFFSITSFSQTTQEEYNYLTKGYKIQLESGLDNKAGYSFEVLSNCNYTVTSGNVAKIEFKALKKTGVDKPVAVSMVYRAPNGLTFYYCIPSNGSGSDIWSQYNNSLSADIIYNRINAPAISYALSYYANYLLAR